MIDAKTRLLHELHEALDDKTVVGRGGVWLSVEQVKTIVAGNPSPSVNEMTGTAPTPESKQLLEILRDANEVCRSAYSIAQRKGEQTNWDAWTRRLKRTLDLQHPLIYPNVASAAENSNTQPLQEGHSSYVNDAPTTSPGPNRERTDPWHESKQEWCVTTAKRAFVNAKAEQLDAEIVSESKPTSEQTERKGFTRDDDGNEVHFTKRMVTMKPTSEGARSFAEKWLGERYVEKYPGQVIHEVSVQMAVDLAEAYAAPFRSQLAAAEKERDYIAKVCAKAEFNYASETACRLSWQQRAEAAESELQCLRERIAELEGSK